MVSLCWRERIDPLVAGVSVSGTSIFASNSDAGALIIEAAMRWPAISGNFPDSIATYATSTPPATFAIPPTITAVSSDFVSLAK